MNIYESKEALLRYLLDIKDDKIEVGNLWIGMDLYMDKKEFEDKEFLINLIKISSIFIHLIPEKLKDDKDILLTILEQYSKDEQYISPNDLEFQLEYTSNELFYDKDFLKKALTFFPKTYSYLTDEQKLDSEITNLALKLSLDNFMYVPKGVHIDRDIAINLVKKEAFYYNDIKTEYQTDKEILFEVLKEDGNMFYQAPSYFQYNEDIICEAVKKYNISLDLIEHTMWKSPTFILKMAKISGTQILKYIENLDIYKYDIDFSKKLVKENINFYLFIPESFKENPEIKDLKEKEEEKLYQKKLIKTEVEKKLDKRWDNFIEKLFIKKEMSLNEFLRLFYDTFQYFRKRKDKSVLDLGSLHILSSLNSLKSLPVDFEPSGCKLNSFNAARAISEDLLDEIKEGMPGYFSDNEMVYLRYCTPPAGCGEEEIHFETFRIFKNQFSEIVDEFDSHFESYRFSPYYYERYNIK